MEIRNKLARIKFFPSYGDLLHGIQYDQATSSQVHEESLSWPSKAFSTFQEVIWTVTGT